MELYSSSLTRNTLAETGITLFKTKRALWKRERSCGNNWHAIMASTEAASSGCGRSSGDLKSGDSHELYSSGSVHILEKFFCQAMAVTPKVFPISSMVLWWGRYDLLIFRWISNNIVRFRLSAVNLLKCRAAGRRKWRPDLVEES